MSSVDVARDFEPDSRPEPEDVAGMSPDERAARKTARSIRRPDPPPVEITDDEGYDKLKPGTKYIGPDKQVQTKLYTVSSDEDFDALPEGVEFMDPEGQKWKKPVSEDVGFTAQMLHDMARTPEGQEKALRVIYGDRVKKDSLGGLYVEDEDGKLRRPKARGLVSGAGAQMAELAPGLGMVAGGALGFGGGELVEPLGGGIPAGFGGAVIGAMAGRQVNNVVLGLAGIHEGLGPQITSLAQEGAGVALGEVGGRAIAKTAGAMRGSMHATSEVGQKLGGDKSLGDLIGRNLPRAFEALGQGPKEARGLLIGGGDEQADKVALTRATQSADITNRGGRVPPSKSMPAAPYLKKLEEFDKVFTGLSRFDEANEALYNKEVRELLEDKEIGVNLDELATRATKKVSSEAAGQQVLATAQREMAMADAAMENDIRNIKEQVARPIQEAGGVDRVAELRRVAIEKLQASHERAKQAAENVIQSAVRGLHEDVDLSMRAAGQHEDPSALNRKIAAEFDAYNVGTRAAAKKLYGAIEPVTEGVLPDVGSLADDAEAFLRNMPEQIRAKYPGDIAALKKLAPKVEAEGGSDAAEPFESITYPQLHHLRSWFRHGIDYEDMTPDMKTGALKLFEKKINSVLHDPNAPAPLREAAGFLDQADAFYKANIPFLNDEMVKGTVNLLRSGVGADPIALAKLFFNPERTAAARRVRGIVGENLWSAVQDAHLKHMLDNSKIIGSNQIDGARFAAQVEDLDRNGLLATAYDPVTAKRITKVAADVRRLGGQLPISPEETDTISSLMRRMQIATQQVEKMAELDPIKALVDETKRLDKELAGKLKTAKQQRQIDPLGFLYEDSMSALAVKAADRILGSPDLLKAAAEKFGRDSGEFKALQQVYAMRFFQRSFEKTGGMRLELEKTMTEEVQALMFPGATRKTMLQIARDMEFLSSAGGPDVGASMAGASRVLHPEQSIPFVGKIFKLVQVPMLGAGARFAYAKYLATMMDAVSHPSFINWLAGKLEGDAVARAEAKAAWQHRMNLAVGAGRVVGQQVMTGPQQPEEPQ